MFSHCSDVSIIDFARVVTGWIMDVRAATGNLRENSGNPENVSPNVNSCNHFTSDLILFSDLKTCENLNNLEIFNWNISFKQSGF